MISVAMVGITVAVSVVGIRVGVVSMVGITVGGVAIAIRSFSISRPLVVAVVAIAVSMVSITISRVAIAIRDSMMASISFSFGLSCDSCEQAEGDNGLKTKIVCSQL